MARLFDTGIFSVNGTNGAVGSGYKLNFYTTGTSTRKATYPTRADADAATNANANPISAAADGRWAPIWLTSGDYKVVLTDLDDVVLETRDPGDNNVESQLSGSGGAALVGFLQAGAGAVARTIQSKLRDVISVLDFGAVGDGAADDTGAITAAIAAVIAAGGGTLWMPEGTYKVTSAITISSPMKIVGVGLGSIISTTSVFADIFTVTATASNPGVEFEDLRFQASVTRTSGQYINSSSANGTKVRRCRFDAGYIAVAATGSDKEGFVVEDCEIIGQTNTGVNVTASTGAQGNTSSYIQNNLITGAAVGSQTPTAINVAVAGDITIRGNMTLYCSSSVSASPATGKTVQALRIIDNWFDNGTANGIAVSPTGGTVRLVTISGNWIASFTLDGVLASGTGTIQKIEILNNAIGTNAGNCINLSSTIIAETVISGNTIGGATSSGISIVANLNKFRIINNSIGVTGQFTQNGAWDILLNAGTSTDYNISDNTLTGGVSGSLSNGGTGAVKYVRNNIGYTNYAKGATSVADGGAITHGLVAAPTSVRCTTSVASEFVSVTSLTSSNFTVAIKKHDNSAGTTQTIYWEAEV